MKREARVFLYWFTVAVTIGFILAGLYFGMDFIINEGLKAAVKGI